MGRSSRGLLFGFIAFMVMALAGAASVNAANTVTVLNAQGCTGNQITVTINLSNASTVVDAFGFHFHYNSSHMSYVSCAPGTLDPGWYNFGCSEPTPGDVIIGAYATTGSIPVNSTGSLAVLTFDVTCGSCMPGVTSPMTIDQMVDDLNAFGPYFGIAVPGTFSFVCPTATPTATLVPTSTPTSGPTATPAPIPALGGAGTLLLIALLGLGIITRRK